MARLYSNENFPAEVVLALRQLGHNVLTALDAEQANRRIDDAEVLAFGTAHRRAVVTMNRRDFLRLHAELADHGGIIVCTEDRDYAGQARRIHAAIADRAELTGLLLRVVRPSTPRNAPT